MVSVITGVIIAVVIVIVLVLLGILYRYCRSPEKHTAPVKYKKHKKSHGYKRSGFGYYPPGGWSSDIGHSSSDEEAGRGADSGHESFGHDSCGHDGGGHDSGGHGSGGLDSGCHDSGGHDSGVGGHSGGGGCDGTVVEEGVTAVADVTE